MFTLPLVLTSSFFLLILSIAYWGMRQTSDLNDFFLGGKKFGAWILAISYGSTQFSAVVFVGFAGKFGWQCGLTSLWTSVGCALLGTAAAWILLGRRIRRMSHNLGARTMPEFFSARYGTNGMKIISALVIFVFLLPYSASVFMGLSYLFEITFRGTKVFGHEVNFAMVLTTITLVSFFYITFGGYKAIARIDFIQGMIMFFAALAMVTIIANHFGGFFAAATSVTENLRQRIAGGEGIPSHLQITPPPWYFLPSMIFMTSVGIWALPQMSHIFFAIRDEQQVKRGATMSVCFALVIGFCAYFTGSMTHLMPVESIPTYVNAAGVTGIDFDRLVPDLIAATLPPSLLAVVLLLILSASMSTLSSLVLISSSAVTIDLYKGYINPKASPRGELLLMRALCGCFIFLSYLIALCQPTWIMALLAISYGTVSGAFLAPYLYGLFWKRTTKLGAYAGMWTGLLLSNGLYWSLFIFKGRAFAVMNSSLVASIAIAVPLLVVPIVSLMTKPPKEEMVERAFNDENA